MLVDQNFPDFLSGLVAVARLALAGSRFEQIIDLQHLRIGRSATLRTVRGIPCGKFGSHVGLGRINRDRVAGEQIEQFRTAIGPDHDLVLVVSGAGGRQCPLHFAHIGLNADLAPLFADHFGLLRPWQQGFDSLHLNPQPLAIVGAHAIAFGILLGQADAVEQLVGLGNVELGIFVTIFLAGALRHLDRGSHRTG